MLSVGIVGLGLLGGSLGMALKGSYHRIGWGRREDNRSAALELDAVDEVCADAAVLLQKADITVLAIPVQATIDFMAEHAKDFPKGAVVTDVGSLKGKSAGRQTGFCCPGACVLQVPTRWRGLKNTVSERHFPHFIPMRTFSFSKAAVPTLKRFQ